MSFLQLGVDLRWRLLAWIVMTLGCGFPWPMAVPAGENDWPAAQLEFFENQVRPLLAEHCYRCHSDRAPSPKGGLRLDGRHWMIGGGDSGPAIVAGQPQNSLLIEAVRWQSLEMPPGGKLDESQIRVLTKWIALGAPWPANRGAALPPASNQYDWDSLRRGHWSFRPIREPRVPPAGGSSWVRNPIDNFVLRRLTKARMKPAAPAPPRLLVRRIYFDLVGLPPSPAEVERFVTAAAANRWQAVESLVGRLLDSPHYGERWARHWLDVARYSDGFGGFLDRAALPEAWRYRDWVTGAFNRDLPYDQFVRLQIAGDLIDPQEASVATGFLALGPTYRSDGGDPASVAQAKSETLDDRVDTLSRGLLGLTVSCARCHDHKFDPIPQQDYYSLAGVFNNSATTKAPLSAPRIVQAYDEHTSRVAELAKRIKQRQKQAARQPLDPAAARELESWKAELAKRRKAPPPAYDFAHALTDSGDADMHVAIRGDLRKRGPLAPRRFLRIVAGSEPERFGPGSGRLALAEALVAPDNPLTARVLINRVWQQHFGRALVRTPSNFGKLGEPPTHPELLDWLSSQFVGNGWSIKQLHRTIMTSATYQSSSDFDQENFDRDGDNRLLWRMNPRRLEVEAWRDALLAVTGELDLSLGGPPLDKIDHRRRTLYFKVSRNGDQFASDELLRLFDFPLMRATVAQRPTSIVPQQYLFMMNSRFMSDRAKAFVDRLHREADTDAERIVLAYQLLSSRPPTADEAKIGAQFLSHTSADDPTGSRWPTYAQALLSSNGFLFVQ